MWPWKIWRCRRHIFQIFVSMDHFASDASVFWWSFTKTRSRLDPHLNFFKYPIPDQYLIFHTRSTPNVHSSEFVLGILLLFYRCLSMCIKSNAFLLSSYYIY